MHSLLQSRDLRMLLVREGPAFCLALLVAELFFKFGSFSLECLGFLATWYALGRAGHALLGRPAQGDEP